MCCTIIEDQNFMLMLDDDDEMESDDLDFLGSNTFDDLEDQDELDMDDD